MTNIDALIERLRKRQAFILNGSTWMMVPQQDMECQEAAAALAELQRNAERRVCAHSCEVNALKAEIAKLQEINVKQADRKDAEIARLTKDWEDWSKADRETRAEIAKLREALGKIVSLEWTAADGGEPASIARAALGERPESEFGKFVLSRSMGGNDGD